MKKTQSYFEQEIRKTEFFKALEAAGVNPQFADSRGATLYFKLPRVQDATQAVKDIMNTLGEIYKPSVPAIESAFNDKFHVGYIGKSFKSLAPKGEVKVSYVKNYEPQCNFVFVHTGQPSRQDKADRFVMALNEVYEKSPKWFPKAKSIPAVDLPDPLREGFLWTEQKGLQPYNVTKITRSNPEDSVVEKVLERLGSKADKPANAR